MTCQLDQISCIEDILSINKYLNVEYYKKEQLVDDNAQLWNETDWSWGDQPINEEKKPVVNSDWLQDVLISMTATEEFIVIANQDKIIFLTQKWDYNEANTKLKYVKCFEGSVTQEINEKITCVLCIPLASQKRSTNGASDWTCIIVGYNSGYIRIYTEHGTLLISQIFSDDEILKIKCHTYVAPRHPAEPDHIEEVCILYRNSLVTIDGFSFFQSIKACKNQVARASASGVEMLQPPPLAYKKWALLEQATQKDFVPCGVINSTIYDQMKTDSLIIGAHANPRSTLVSVNLYISTGSQPFLGFYYAQHAHTQPFLSEVAHAVASKLKSAFLSAASGWLGIGGSKPKSDPKEKKPKIEPATNISPRFGLYDKRRCCNQIELSSDGKMSAVVDDFGRVLLIDVQKGIVVRMWKGYRDAQVAWVETKEEELNSQTTRNIRRFAFFLAIYAPRRGLLEIWACQMGARVATFMVGKTCRLLSPSGMLGLNSATVSQHQVGTVNGAAYLLCPDGIILKIIVPFHCVLGDKGSVSIHDMHLLKQLKNNLKVTQKESELLKKDLLTLLQEIKTSEIKKQALDQIMATKYLNVEFLIDVTENFKANLKNSSSEPDNNYALITLLHLCDFYVMLLHTYSNIVTLNKHTNSSENVIDNFGLLKEYLSLEDREAQDLNDLYSNYFHLLNHFKGNKKDSTIPTNRVRFKTMEISFTPAEFVSHFECEVFKSGSAKGYMSLSNNKTEQDIYALNMDNDDSKINNDIQNIHHDDDAISTNKEAKYDENDENNQKLDGDVKSCSDMKVLVNAVLGEFQFDAKKMNLAEFLFNYIFVGNDWQEFSNIIKSSCIVSSDILKLLEYYILSKKLISLNCIPALVNIMQVLYSRKDDILKDNKENLNYDAFITMCSQSDNISSALLLTCVTRHVNKLAPESVKNGDDWESIQMDRERMLVLSNRLQDLLDLKALLIITPTEEMSTTYPTNDKLKLSLKKIEEGGKGMIPELIGTWVHANNLDVAYFTNNSENENNNPNHHLINGQLKRLYNRFPLTLTQDSIFSNCCFEYAVSWNKDPENIDQLNALLQYLRCIHNDQLKHGLSLMLWQMFLLKRISATTLLIDKVGKTPKDRLCRKDIGLNETAVIKLLKLSIDLLIIISESQSSADRSPQIEKCLYIEDNWDSVLGGSSAGSSLTQLAVEQRPANFYFVYIHINLCRILVAILNFSMKSVKPKSQLFDSKNQLLLFRPLYSGTNIDQHSDLDPVVQEARISFLKKLLTHAIMAIGDNIGESISEEQYSTYYYWSDVVEKLGAFFRLDMDEVHSHHVLELYNSGFDQIAEQVSLNVSEHSKLGEDLLMLCGQRLAHHLANVNAAEVAHLLSRCSPNISTWLKSQITSNLRCPTVKLIETKKLLSQIIQMVPENSATYKNTIELIDFLQTLD